MEPRPTLYSKDVLTFLNYMACRKFLTLPVFKDGALQELKDFGAPLVDGFTVKFNTSRVVVSPGNKLEVSKDPEVALNHVRVMKSLDFDSFDWRICVHEDTKRLRSTLEQEKFVLGEISTVMILDISSPPACDPPTPNLLFRRALRQESMDEYASIHAEFSKSTLLFIRSFDSSHPIFIKSHFFFVGYLDGRPVTCCCVIRTDEGLAGMHMVATHPEFRRKGLATKIVIHAMAQVAQDDRSVKTFVLNAASESVGLYRRLGFREVIQHASYGFKKAKD